MSLKGKIKYYIAYSDDVMEAQSIIESNGILYLPITNNNKYIGFKECNVDSNIQEFFHPVNEDIYIALFDPEYKIISLGSGKYKILCNEIDFENEMALQNSCLKDFPFTALKIAFDYNNTSLTRYIFIEGYKKLFLRNKKMATEFANDYINKVDLVKGLFSADDIIYNTKYCKIYHDYITSINIDNLHEKRKEYFKNKKFMNEIKIMLSTNYLLGKTKNKEVYYYIKNEIGKIKSDDNKQIMWMMRKKKSYDLIKYIEYDYIEYIESISKIMDSLVKMKFSKFLSIKHYVTNIVVLIANLLLVDPTKKNGITYRNAILKTYSSVQRLNKHITLEDRNMKKIKE